MLYKLYSDLPSFKTVEFHEGLNLILADKTEKSTQGQTRNGAGKSSIVELINSLLGGRVEKSKGSLLKQEELENYNFGLELDLHNDLITIERNGAQQSRIWVRNIENKLFDLTELNGKYYTHLNDWKAELGKSMFGLSSDFLSLKHTPTFRSLCAFFARSSGGFNFPDKSTTQQYTWSKQVNVSFLLKLDWMVVREFEGLRQREDLIKALNKASNEGALGDIMGSASDLRTDIHLKQTRIDKLKSSVLEFKVLPEYEEKESRATEISKQLASLSAGDTIDKEWLSQLEHAIESEKEPDSSKVMRLFAEAETDIPEIIKRRFDEVDAFHKSVVVNRKEHLNQEIESLNDKIRKRYKQKSNLDYERSEILSLLQSHGALDQYMKLQGLLSKDESIVELLKRKLEATENLDDKKSDLKIERQTTLRKMRIDHAERTEQIKDAVVTFSDISGQLYEDSGRFTIEQTDNGPSFEFDIPGKKSTGKSKMQIFCFDMMLMKLWSGEKQRPEFLIHDSLIFDGVDERQIAKALVIGAEMAKKYNFQYIVTMNTDDLPNMNEYPNFKIEEYRVDLDINDKPNGGLFGLRF